MTLLADMWPVATARQGTLAKLVLATKLTAGKLARSPPVLSARWTGHAVDASKAVCESICTGAQTSVLLALMLVKQACLSNESLLTAASRSQLAFSVNL